MTGDVEVQPMSAVLEETAAELLERAGWKSRAVDAVAVARRLGLTVARDRKLDGRARYVRLSVGRGRTRGAIFVGRDSRPERLQWAVAHELGEFIAHRVFARLDMRAGDDTPARREEVANELARRILLPRRPFERSGRASQWDLFELKQTFPSASHEIIARRMLDLPSPLVVTVFDRGQVSWRRGNRATLLTAPSPAEWSLAEAARERNEFRERAAESLRLRAWPIHEPGWQREIVRTEPVQPGDGE